MLRRYRISIFADKSCFLSFSRSLQVCYKIFQVDQCLMQQQEEFQLDHKYLDVLWYTVITDIWMCYGILWSQIFGCVMVYCDHKYLDVLWYTVITNIWMCYGILWSQIFGCVMVYCDHKYLDVLWYTVITNIWMCYGILWSQIFGCVLVYCDHRYLDVLMVFCHHT